MFSQTLSVDFNNGSAAGWAPKITPGWAVVSGAYRGTNSTANTPVESVWSAGYAWQDYTVSADVSLHGTYAPSEASVLFRYLEQPYGAQRFGQCRLLRDYTQIRLELVEYDRGVIASTPFAAQLNTWYNLRASIVGTQATCEVAGYPNSRVTGTYLGNATGTIGLRATHSPAWFDNVSVAPATQTSSTPGRLFLVAFTGFGNAPGDGSSAYAVGERKTGAGMTVAVHNALAQIPGIVAKAFPFYSRREGCDQLCARVAPLDETDHFEARDWLETRNFGTNDRIVIAGHSYGGHRARLFAWQVFSRYGVRPQALILADPIDWMACSINAVVSGDVPVCDQSAGAYVVPPVVRQKVFRQQTDALKGYHFQGDEGTVVEFQPLSANVTANHMAIDNSERVQRTILSELLGTMLPDPSVKLESSEKITLTKVNTLIERSLTANVPIRNTGVLLAEEFDGKASLACGIVGYSDPTITVPAEVLQGQRTSLTIRWSGTFGVLPLSGSRCILTASWRTNHYLDAITGKPRMYTNLAVPVVIP